MAAPEREIEAGLRNVITAIASPLRPGAMLAGPVVHAILLQRTMSLPGAVSCPSPLLLPRDCLLLGTLRLLPGRLGTLGLLLREPPLLLRLLSRSLLRPLLLRLLSRSLLRPLLLRLLSRSLLRPLLLRLLSRSLLRPLLLRLLSRSLLRPLLLRLLFGSLLGPLLLRLLFRSLLGPLLLRLLSRSRLRPLLLRLPLRFAFFFLRVGRVNRPEQHEQGANADHSNQLHRNSSPLISLLGVHADDQSAPERCSNAMAVASYFLVSGVTHSTGSGAGVSARCATIPEALSVGLSVVPKSAAVSAAEEISRAPVSFRVFFARLRHSGPSQ